MHMDNYDDSNGDVATDMFLSSYLKNAVDTQTSSNTKYVMANEKKVVDAMSVYETGFGMLKVHVHRYLYQSTDSYGRVLLARPEKLKIAYLEKPRIDTGLSRSGDYDSRAVVGKLCLEVRNQDSHVYHEGFFNG